MRSPGPALVVAAVLVAGCTIPAGTPPAGPTHAIAGVVRDAATGAPLAGARVYAEASPLGEPVNRTDAYLAAMRATEVLADAEGRFTIAASPGAALAVRAAGYFPGTCRGGGGPITCVLAPRGPVLVTAHRGGAAWAPENTLAAMRKAALMGADRTEFDVQLSLDFVPFLMHDDTVDRTTDGAGPMWQLTAAQVRALDAGSWFDLSFAGEPVPTLDDALALAKELGLFVVAEAKQPGSPTADPRHQLVRVMAEAVRAHGMEERVVIISFDPTYVAECAATGLRCGTIESEPPEPLGLGTMLFPALAQEWHMPDSAATADHIGEVHGQGMQATVWTINDPARAAELAGLGVDAVTTDVPDQVLAALAAMMPAH